MAFSTIQGSGGAPDSFVGTSGVDTITLINADGNFFLGAQAANDVVAFASTNLTNASVITGATLRGGSGSDTISGFLGAGFFNGVFFNGNEGDDLITFGFNNTLSGSSVQGGKGDDTITVATLSSSLINGNLDDDAIEVTEDGSNSSVFGGKGDDSIKFGFDDGLVRSTVSGDDGNDSILAQGNAGDFSDTSFFGGAGNDSINLSSIFASTPAFPTSGVRIDGGTGNDSLQGTDNADTILGGEGNDTITGNFAADVMTGGTGSDKFSIATGDSGNIATGVIDIITDWAAVDVISGGAFTPGAAPIIVAPQTTYALALAAADASAGGPVIAAVGAAGGSSFTAYLFQNTNAVIGNVTAAVQIGEVGLFSSAALATASVAAAQLTA